MIFFSEIFTTHVDGFVPENRGINFQSPQNEETNSGRARIPRRAHSKEEEKAVEAIVD
jgi:hypothetical protein